MIVAARLGRPPAVTEAATSSVPDVTIGDCDDLVRGTLDRIVDHNDVEVGGLIHLAASEHKALADLTGALSGSLGEAMKIVTARASRCLTARAPCVSTSRTHECAAPRILSISLSSVP